MLICPKCRTTFSSAMLTTCYRDGAQLVDYERFVAEERDPLRNVLIAGKYQLIERVGQGGMGTIYRGVQAGLNRQVAVKILKRELNADPDTVARFHREAHAMSMLTHPNTVRVYDFGQTEDGLLYLVMELLVGELLTSRMDRGAVDLMDAVRMTQQILHSLGEAHRKAIVHRDLKPDNVFVLQAEGHGEPVIKVLDFGIAKLVAPDRRVDQFETQAGTVFGTPRYMSPEQAQGAALDARSDLYSVGALLYQMLTGRAPFIEDDAVVVMAKHIQELPEQPIRVRPDRPIPERLNQVVMRALSKAPVDRFQEAGEFVAALEECVPEVVRAQEAALQGAWAPRRRPRMLYPLLAAMLFGVGYFGVRAYAKLRTPQEGISTVQLAPKQTSAPAPEMDLPESAREVEPEATVATHQEPAPPVAIAMIDITSEPRGASVYRGGVKLGSTPLQVPVRADQPVRIELRHTGYQPLSTELRADDRARTLSLTPVRSGRRTRGDSNREEPRPTPSASPEQHRSSPREPYERFE